MMSVRRTDAHTDLPIGEHFQHLFMIVIVLALICILLCCAHCSGHSRAKCRKDQELTTVSVIRCFKHAKVASLTASGAREFWSSAQLWDALTRIVYVDVYSAAVHLSPALCKMLLTVAIMCMHFISCCLLGYARLNGSASISPSKVHMSKCTSSGPSESCASDESEAHECMIM